ncbi:putrescine-binding periplasmic protein [Bacterioplanes sanyensis]|uniref:polyamine ABC transporter substrate-binding protein n=1 Tax=Bacterioplanes sanyensis TaxID=1249553 RepID=UPI0016729232|nr:polyamine ABC transporter substrate-binding protein [Bacterioplanes sanyensis]GGY52783.1 putrescine-binding periplasmic protein [Bacterioplanes sanyensis]
MKKLLTALTASMALTAHAEQSLHIYNWSDYIAEDTIANFEQETGIRVTYDVYDANEVLEAKMLAGSSGYDLIFPTARPFADRLLRAELLQPLQLEQLDQHSNLDPVILNSLSKIDPDNQHLIPYMWGSSGIAYNVDKVTAILGDDMPLDTWRLVFDPEITAQLKDCGIALMDDPIEVFMAARTYQGAATDDFSRAAINSVADTISAVRPHIRYFHSSQTINDMANGDICVAHGYSGDMLQAQDRADEADNGVQIQYVVPQEGAVVWTDVVAIPADAPNVEAAHQFLNYLMRPEVIADITNYVAYANANSAATELLDEDIRSNPGIYPPKATQEKLIVLTPPGERELRNLNRMWTRAKTNR